MVSRDKAARMTAIGRYLRECDCDVACLQEVWSLADFTALRLVASDRLPYSHYFHSGVVGSGVCVLSRHKIQEAFFHRWPLNGYAHKVQHGDWWGGKGVGLVRLCVQPGDVDVLVYTAHLHAEYDRERDMYLSHRVLQALDTAQFVRLTAQGADAFVLAGDLNSEPEDLAYRLLLAVTGLRDSCLSVGWTNDAPDNTYAVKGAQPKRIDYVLWGGAAICGAETRLPLPALVPGTCHSYSDHEAVFATLRLDGGGKQTSSCFSRRVLPPAPGPLREALHVLEGARDDLRTHRRTYLLVCAVLCLLLWTPSLLQWAMPGGLLFELARLAATAAMLFALLMATAWNATEANAVTAAADSLRFYLQDSS